MSTPTDAVVTDPSLPYAPDECPTPDDFYRLVMPPLLSAVPAAAETRSFSVSLDSFRRRSVV